MSRRNRIVVVLMVLVTCAAAVVAAWQFGPWHHRSAGLTAQLEQHGYRLTSERSNFSAEAGRQIRDQTWTRQQAPSTILLSDDTSPSAGTFVINNIDFGTFGASGQFWCTLHQGAEASSDLGSILNDAVSLHQSVLDGKISPKFASQAAQLPNAYTFTVDGRLADCFMRF